MSTKRNESHRRWRGLLALSVPVLSFVALFVTRRHVPPEPAAAHRDESSPVGPRSSLHAARPAAPMPEPSPAVTQPASGTSVTAEARRDQPPATAPAAPEHEGESLREGATQDEIMAYMAKAKAMRAEPSQAAADERDHHVGELASSGDGGAEWLGHFKQVENDWLAIDNREGLGIQFTDWQCFKKGCTTTMRAPSVETLERFRSFVFNGKTTAEWRGAGFCSGPIRMDTGEIETTCIFYAPTS
jgi:hypothetical protein